MVVDLALNISSKKVIWSGKKSNNEEICIDSGIFERFRAWTIFMILVGTPLEWYEVFKV